jgi:uncharacterized DUF497 family protein
MYTDNEGFEWDSAKALSNSIKHGVGFKEAASAFDDPEKLLTDDFAHSRYETRYVLVGETAIGRLIVVAFTVRPGPVFRIISARDATQYEKERYEVDR